MNPWISILFVLAALGGLIGTVHFSPFKGEAARKAIHLGMGCICLSFPWLFQATWPVNLLAALATLALLALRFLKPAVGKVLHDIARRSIGELLFPIGVALVFRLSDGVNSLYLPAVAILTFGDSAGALIGRRFGKHQYRTNAGTKSIEGSSAVFFVSALIVFILGKHQDLPTALLTALVAGLFIAMAEGILASGVDNLILPITSYALLYFLRDLSLPELFSRIGIISALASVLFFVRKITSLNGGGLLSVMIFGYLCLALGGPSFLIAPAILFTIHLLTCWRAHELRSMEHSADAVAAIVIPGLIWITLKTSNQYPEATCYTGFTITLMTQVALLHTATRRHLEKRSCRFMGLIKTSATGIALTPFWLAPALAIPISLGAIQLGALNRIEQSVLSFTASLPILFL